MKKLTLLLIPALVLSCTQNSGTTLTDEQKQKNSEEIKSVISQFFEAAAKADSIKLLDIFAATPDSRYIGTEGEMLDYTAFKQMIGQFYSTINTEIIKEGTQKITHIDANTVLWTNHGSVTTEFKNGWQLSYKPFVITLLLKKADNKWKATFIQESGKLSADSDTTGNK